MSAQSPMNEASQVISKRYHLVDFAIFRDDQAIYTVRHHHRMLREDSPIGDKSFNKKEPMKNSMKALTKTVALLFVVPMSAIAQTPVPAPAPLGLDEIVVTAQKRAEKLQDVPLSIIAVSGETLEDAGIRDPTDLGKLVPSLQINNGLFSGGVVIRIRGFGSASNSATDSDVATYLDSAFIPRPGAILGSFLDIKNVEVLSGPQGTLFGRNAAMGAISINSNSPSSDEHSIEAKFEGAKYGTYSGTVIANLPVNDKFAVRFALNSSHTDGIFENRLDGKTYGNRDQTVGRVSTKLDLSRDVSWTVRADAARTTGDGVYPATVYTNTASAAQLTALTTFNTRFGGTQQVYSDKPSYDFNSFFGKPAIIDKQAGITSDLSWALSPVLTARLIDTYRDWNSKQLSYDTIATSLDLLNILQANSSKAQSHELQLISSKGAFLGKTLGFTSGLYYFKEEFEFGSTFNAGSQFCSAIFTTLGRPFLIPGCLAGPQTNAGIATIQQTAKSRAGYVQANYAILPALDLDVGIRRTSDSKSGTFAAVTKNPLVTGAIFAPEGPEALEFRDSNTSYRASLSWHPTDKITAFATYATGYKSGGFNSGASAPALNSALRGFKSETVDDVELGVKSVFWDKRFRLNATLFNTKLKDFQDRSFNGSSFVIRNAGDVRSKGVDLDGQILPVPEVKLNYGLTYLDSIYTSNPNAPGLEGCTVVGAAAGGCPITQNLTGKELAFAPKWHGNVGAQWASPAFRGGYTTTWAISENFTSGFLTANNNNPQSRLDSYRTTDLRVSLHSPDKSWQLDLFGSNIFDKHYYVSTVAQVVGGVIPGVTSPVTGATVYRGFLGDPARFGVRLSVKF